MRGRFRPASRAAATFAAAALTVGVVAGLWLWRGKAAKPDAPRGPVILISIDTLRADRLPAYGYTAIRTPAIDRLAADGLLFEQAYAHVPQTLPSHVSILSGRLPHEHGVRDNIGFVVRPGEWMLQHALSEAGYRTAAFVSSFVLRRQTGIDQGFAHYDDALPAASPERPLGMVQRSGDDTVASAIRWIDTQPDGRYFLFLHIFEPHTPYEPPARFAAAHPYDGEVQHADAIVGKLLDHLRSKGQYDDAAIVLLSDHGEGLGDHGEEEHGIFLYRETIRVPLIVKAPRARVTGARVATVVQHLDVAPTIADFAKIAAPGAGGRSLRPVLDGTGRVGDASVYSESLSPRYHFGWSELYALTDERYRLIRAPRDELYDVQQDPAELASIAGARPQVHAAMRRALEAIISRAEVHAPSAVSDEDRRRLAALGYVGTQTSATDARAGMLPDPKDKIGVLTEYRRAAALASERRWTEAAALYRTLLAGDPQMTDVWLQLARAEQRIGRADAALAAYRAVIERDPTNAAALTGAAAVLLQLGRVDEARAHAELAVGTAPAIANETLARLALERGDDQAARHAAALAEQADPTLPIRAFIEGAILHRQQRFAEAVPPLRAAIAVMARRTEQMPDVHYLLGDALARLEQYAEAERMLLAELSISPDHLRARAALAMLYRATGRDALSDRAVEELVRRHRTREGYRLAADLWSMFGQPARAAAMRARSASAPR